MYVDEKRGVVLKFFKIGDVVFLRVEKNNKLLSFFCYGFIKVVYKMESESMVWNDLGLEFRCNLVFFKNCCILGRF